MDSHKLIVKFFADDPAPVPLAEFVPVFHGFIQQKALPDHLLIGRTMTRDGRIALLMEWLEGETLATRLAAHGGRWPIDTLVDFASALAERVDAVHAVASTYAERAGS